MTRPLEGRVALLTGSTDGIGLATARALAAQCCAVMLNGFGEPDAISALRRELAQAHGVEFAHTDADLRDEQAASGIVGQVLARFGRLDILVNNAGTQHKGPVEDHPPQRWREVMALNLDAAFHTIRTALPGMRERGWGRFVSIGGDMAEHWTFGPPDAPLDYPLGKAARHWITRTIARRESVHGVTINAVAPGPTDRVALPDATAAAQGGVSGGDDNAPQDVANAVSFLCSDAAARVTGAIIPVPGSRSV
jgi:3-hydroxybutyrate dehydrogenase